MKSIIGFSIKNKLAIWIVTCFIIVFGTYVGFSMKLETIPNINEPVVNITTVYPGASPETVMSDVTEPIEKKVHNLEGVKNVTSTSFEGASTIAIQYDFKINMEKAENEIKEIMSGVKLPEGVTAPEVARVNFNDLPVFVLSLTDSTKKLEDLSKLSEKEIMPAFEEVEGVSKVEILGKQNKEVEIKYKQDKLDQYGLSVKEVNTYLKTIKNDVNLGMQVLDGKEKVIKVNGAEGSLEKIRELHIPINLKIQNSNSVERDISVSLKDIADVTIVQKAQSVSKTNGMEGISIRILQSSNGNTVDVVDGVKEKVKKLQKKHNSLEFVSVLDSGEPIKGSVGMMVNKTLMGAAFAILIILLFLRDIKSTIIAVISIPLSLVISLIILNHLDMTLNLMTLGAMTVAIGRVIDDSIVVIENIYRRMTLAEEKLSGINLIKAATSEMFSSIMSSTIVTIAVFLPLGLIDGPVGELFMPFGVTIVCALLASLIVSITVVPMMAHLMLKKKGKVVKKVSSNRVATSYYKILNWSLNHKLITFCIASALFIGSIFLIPSIGVSFIGSSENKMILATYNPLPGATEDTIKGDVKKAEEYLLKRDHIKMVQSSYGEGNPLNPADKKQVLFFITYKDGLKDLSKEQKSIFNDLQKLGMGEWGFNSSGNSNGKVDIFVYGKTIDEIRPVADSVKKTLEDNEKVTNVKLDLSDSLRQVNFTLNTEKLVTLGIQPTQIYNKLGSAKEEKIGNLKIDGQEIPIRTVERDAIVHQEELSKQQVTTNSNQKIELGEVLQKAESDVPAFITKRNGDIYTKISAEITDKDAGKVTENIQKQIDELSVPSGVQINVGGVTEQIDESFTQLGIAMVSAIVIVYFVLVVTFGGGLAPLAILFSLPYALIGSLLGLLITNEPISVSVMIGALMLIGIVVTNAVVLIDRAITNEQKGILLRESILEAGVTRLRPILMTAIATIGALSPLLFAETSDGSGLISKGLGVTVIGGLTSSTLLTLIIVPVVYEGLMKLKHRWAKKRKDRQELKIGA
ncbi:efflux RND transporter permease subunit [Bacillus sp. BP-3]|uniref:efflux RND transporter permease subunit n=1 Tax=Bacillus sp. BP-3 TaxID=3022773 RepID=UPI002330E611|nr:efflux RND transporter permease subunit [Bacillus sp. BP-3]MDC2865496.1 efflux RND transporter permease subunit [Bacillus sp. BP-3]